MPLARRLGSSGGIPTSRSCAGRRDILALAATQLAILEACFRMLAPGGRLIYATCSVLPAENQAVLTAFLENHRRNAIALPAIAGGSGARRQN